MKKLLCLIITAVLGYYSIYGANLSQVYIEEEKDSLMLPGWKELKKKYITPIIKDTLVDNSSLYELIGLFLHPEAKFTRKERRQIEDLFCIFPDSIINNDTATFYVHSVAKIKYYELIKKDYNKVLDVLTLTREQYGKPPIANNLSELFENLSFYPSPFDDSSELGIENRISRKKKKIDVWTGFPFTDRGTGSIHIPLDLSYRSYNLLLGIYKKNGWDNPISLYETISHNRYDILRLILAYWDVLNVQKVQRNILLCGLLSHSKDKKNEQATQYFKSLFPREYLCNYEKFYESGKSKIVDWEGIHYAILGGWLNLYNNYSNDTYQSMLYAIEYIFGKTSEEYCYIAPKMDIFSAEDYKDIVEKDILEGVNDSVTSLNIVYNILGLYDLLNQHENICQDCIVYEKYISNEHLGDFYYFWGKSEINLRQYTKGIQHLAIAKNYASEDQRERDIDFYIAYAMCELEDYETAVSILHKYIESSKKGSNYDKFTINHRLGYAYKEINREVALTYYQNAIGYIDENNMAFSNEKLKFYLELSELLKENKHLQKKYIDKALLQSELFNMPFITLESDSLELGQIYTALGEYYNSVLNYNKADSYFQLATEFLCGLTLKDKRKVLLNRQYAKNLYDNKMYERSIEMLTELKDAEFEILGKEHIDYLRTLRLLLLATIANEGISSAIQLYDEYERLVPLYPIEINAIEHYEVLYSYQKLMGNPDRAIEILENLVLSSQMNPEILTFSDELITMSLIHQSERSEYINRVVMEKTKEIITYHFTKMYSQDRANWQVPLYSIRSQMINALTESNALQRIAFDFSLYSKNLLFFTQSKFDKELSKSKRNRIAMSELKAMRDSLNTAISQGNYTKVKKIEGEIESKERELYHSIQLKNPYDIRTADVLSVLGRKELAIDFVQYESSEQDTKYGAFLLSHDFESPIFIELCHEDMIREIAIDEEGYLQHEFYGNSASYELIWKKLIPYFEGYENIYFSSDGLLNQLAIEYICNESYERICEKYRIHRVFHLANIKKTEGIGNNFVGIGVADHNSPINDSISTVNRGSWDNLNGIKQEFATIRRSLDVHPEYKTKFMIDDEAREKRIKELDNSSVTALHIATHGFYMDKKTLWEAADDSTHFDYHISCRALGANRESLSGLVLRQGNLSWKSATITDEYDDLLTNDEIENMTFPNLKLTVLSACDTGLGDVDSEGVWGLQRAFRIAGTESLICSLSEISDKWTAKFMDVFYKEVTSGKNIYEAFHTAQDYLFRKNKRNPQIWASMILIE